MWSLMRSSRQAGLPAETGLVGSALLARGPRKAQRSPHSLPRLPSAGVEAVLKVPAWRLGREGGQGKAARSSCQSRGLGSYWPNEMQWFVRPGVRLGKGLLGSHHFSRGQGETLPVSLERTGSSWGHLPPANKDQDSGQLPAVLGVDRRGSREARGEQPPREVGLACPGEKNSTSPPSYPVPLPTTPLPRDHSLLSPSHTRSLGKERSTRAHTGRDSETCTKGRKERPQTLL